MAPPDALATGPVDLVGRALDATRTRPGKRPIDIAMLYTLPADDRHRPAVMAALTPLLDDPEAGGDAARAMEVWAGPGDVPTLIAGLDSDQARVRMFLFRALRRLKPGAAIPALLEHMARPEDRGEASAALGTKAAPEIRKLLTNDDRDARREAARLLKEIGGNDRGMQLSLALGMLKSPDNWDRDRALEDLAKLPVVDASRAEVLAAASPLINADESSNRGNAITAVAAWGTAEQVPAPIEALDDPDRNVRVIAGASLRKIPDPRSALALVRLLSVGPMRKEAVAALVAMKLKDESVEAEVLKAMEGPDWPMRQAACQVLKAIGTAASVPALKKATGDDNQDVARAARAALKAIDPSARPDPPSDMPKPKAPARKKR
jgi:HEAT repeat protein